MWKKENWSLAKLAVFDRDAEKNLRPGGLGVGWLSVCVRVRKKAPLWLCARHWSESSLNLCLQIYGPPIHTSNQKHNHYHNHHQPYTHTHTHTLRAASWCWARLSWINYSGGIKKAHTNTLNHSDSHTHSHHVWLEGRIGNAWKEDKDWNGAFLSKLLHVIYCSNYSQTSVRLFIWNDCKKYINSGWKTRGSLTEISCWTDIAHLAQESSSVSFERMGFIYITVFDTAYCRDYDLLWTLVVTWHHIIYHLLSLMFICFFIYDSSLW